MQILIDNGFVQDAETGGWVCKRLFAYAVGDEVKVRTHNDCRNWEIVHNNDPELLQKLLGELFTNTLKEQMQLMDYAAGVAKVCNENGFPVVYSQRVGKVEFFYNGMQSGFVDPLFLFSVDLSDNEEFFFSSPDCVVYAEDQPIEIELPEIFEVMNTETQYDRHCKEGANLHNRVPAEGKTVVYANTTHALAECLKYGVSNICHQVAQIQVQDTAGTHHVMRILRETKFPEVHAYAITFLSENFNGSAN